MDQQLLAQAGLGEELKKSRVTALEGLQVG